KRPITPCRASTSDGCGSIVPVDCLSGHGHIPETCGRNSGVECQLPKLDVTGSNPVARSEKDTTGDQPPLVPFLLFRMLNPTAKALCARSPPSSCSPSAASSCLPRHHSVSSGSHQPIALPPPPSSP